MAAGIIQAPGTEYGPCQECAHDDCKRTRQMAETACTRCGESIGYMTGFFVADGGYDHEMCVYEALERA